MATMNVPLVQGTLVYLDGGTGSLVLQALLGGVLTMGYVAKTQWGAIRAKIAELGRTRAR